MRFVVLAIVMLALTAACPKNKTSTSETPKPKASPVYYGPDPGGYAPLVALFNPDGTEMKLDALQGEVVLLNFWATWCGPCIEEMPSLQALHEQMADDGLRILAVSVDEDPELAFEFVAEHELSFRTVFDRQQAAATAYRVRTIPVTFLIDRDGKIVSKVRGARDWTDQEMVTRIEEVLKQES